MEKYLDCGNSMCGFARIRCPDCGAERLLMFSCKTRGFCPSCHAKRREEWGEWMRESLVWDVPHRQVVFTVPKMLRVFFRYRRTLLSALCLCVVRALLQYLSTVTGLELMTGIVTVIQTFGSKVNFHPHIHVLITEGGKDTDGVFRRVSHFDDVLIAEFFSREVFSLLLQEHLISLQLVQKILRWRHTGFNVHSKVRAKTKREAKRLGKYMIRPLLALLHLSFDEKEGRVSYQCGKDSQKPETLKPWLPDSE